MNVLFVHSEQDPFSREKPLEIQERIQFGISYISSLLRREGHETGLSVICRETEDSIEEHIRRLNPGLIGFTGVYTEYLFLSRVAERVKRSHPDIFLLLGGPHASLQPERCLRESAFDAVCVGEGEYPTLELAERLDAGKGPYGIPNLLVRKPGGGIERNPPRPFIEDLDGLPFPDREMWMEWVANTDTRPSVLVGRGCPFQCTYCCNHALRKVAPGKYVRLRSPGDIVEELSSLRESDPDFAEVYLEVETLGVNLEWALELCAELKRFNSGLDVPLAFGSNLRVTPNRDYRELFAAFAESNFRFINIGLESGSERIRKEVLNRRYSNQDIVRAVKEAKAHGLQVGMYNLIGLPGETGKDFRQTVRINRECQPDWFLLSVFFPYPGTQLYDKCVELGLLDISPDPDLERRKAVLDLPGFSKRQVNRHRDWFPMFVYRGHRPLKEILWLVSMAKIYSNRRLIDIHRRFLGGFMREKGLVKYDDSPEMRFLSRMEARGSAGYGPAGETETEIPGVKVGGI